MTTQPTPSNPNDWEPCPQGKFRSLSKRLVRKRTRRQFLRSAATVGVVAVGGLALWGFLLPSELSCHEVQQNAQAYKDRTLSPDMLARINKHLAKCPECRSYYHIDGSSGSDCELSSPPTPNACPNSQEC